MSPLDRGERLYRQGDVVEAIRVWRAVSEENVQFDDVQIRLRAVEEEFARLLRRYEKRAAFFEAEGRLAEAVLYYRLTYKLDPERRNVLEHVQLLARQIERLVAQERTRLDAALAAGNLRKAYEYVGRLERLDPFDPHTQVDVREVRATVEAEVAKRLARGKRAYASGDRARAKRAFQDVIRVDPTNQTARGYLSYLKKLDEPSTRAAVKTPAAISEEEMVAEGHVRTGQEAEAEGRLFRALQEYDAALRVDSAHQSARRARDHLRHRLQPQIPELYEAGKRYFQDEDLHNALRVWRQVLLIDPGDGRARENVDRAERILARLEEIQSSAGQ
jgi:tetratricopeptide (TPR) repeat protein